MSYCSQRCQVQGLCWA